MPALFCVHAEAGDVSLYYGLARHLASDQPIVGLCPPDVGDLGADRRLEAMAERHVQEIGRTQPAGPYLIAGECAGGALAYEIARQLRAAGQEIALLALVDAFAPGQPRLPRLMPRAAQRVLHRARILGFHAANLARLDMHARLNYTATRAARAFRATIAAASRVVPHSSRNVSPRQLFREALETYDPGRTEGSVVLFRAARLPLLVKAPPDLGWGSLVERVEVETIPGYFTTAISEPGVRILAERLARQIDKAAKMSTPESVAIDAYAH